MGQEILCTATLGRRSASGKALLETTEIIFRSPDLKMKIPFAAISLLDANSSRLKVAWPGGVAMFEIGDRAVVWAEKIRNPKTRADKLGIKPDHRVVLLNVKERGFLAELRSRAAYVSNGRLLKEVDAIFVGAESLERLESLPELMTYIKPNGAVWTITPKGKGGIKDTDVMAAGKSAGLVDVKVVSFSDTHSANKFVIPKASR